MGSATEGDRYRYTLRGWGGRDQVPSVIVDCEASCSRFSGRAFGQDEESLGSELLDKTTAVYGGEPFTSGLS